MPNKTDYLEQYSAAVRAKNTYDAIVRDIRDERQQLQALNQLIQSERNTLAQLEAASRRRAPNRVSRRKS